MADNYTATYDAPSGPIGTPEYEGTQPHPEGKFHLGEPAQDCYDRLAKYRWNVIETGRILSELTIPSLIPPLGWKVGDKIPGNNQSAGAHCVNTLAAALLFIAFPPNQPIMKLMPVEYEIQEEIDKDPTLYNKMEIALGRLAEAHRTRLMSGTTVLSAYSTAMKYLIVGGNALWKHTELDSPQAFPPTEYVCQRNALGEPLLSIHKETVCVAALSPEDQAIVYDNTPDLKNKTLWEQEVDIYTVCNLCYDADGDKCWEYWQEYKGHLLPGTEVETDFDNPPMIPLWMIPVYGQNWGRSYCEEYRGDLFTAEALSSAINDGAALSALSLLFVNPAGRTSIRQIREARNLSTFPGAATDVTVFRADKSADFAFVQNVMDRVERRLGIAFLLNFAIQRNGERVTAEEIRRLGSELDKALGGMYSELAQRTQRPIMLRFIHLNEEENPKLPKLPKDGLVTVQVITGIDALGNSKEVQDLEDLAGSMAKFFPRQAADILNASGWAMRYAAAKGIKPDDIVNTPEQTDALLMKAAQSRSQASMVDHGTGPAVSGVMDGLLQNGMPNVAKPGAPPIGAGPGAGAPTPLAPTASPQGA